MVTPDTADGLLFGLVGGVLGNFFVTLFFRVTDGYKADNLRIEDIFFLLLMAGGFVVVVATLIGYG